MPSESAKAVAREVIELVGKGGKIHKQRIQEKHGYSKASARSGRALATKTYKKTMAPLIERLEEERDAIIERLKKTRNKAKYRDLIDGLDKTTKNIQLLSGGKTANEEVKITWEK